MVGRSNEVVVKSRDALESGEGTRRAEGTNKGRGDHLTLAGDAISNAIFIQGKHKRNLMKCTNLHAHHRLTKDAYTKSRSRASMCFTI